VQIKAASALAATLARWPGAKSVASWHQWRGESTLRARKADQQTWRVGINFIAYL